MTKIIKMRHLAVIIGIVLIAIGMAVGTICHFVGGGFFSYGGEFASYKSVEVTAYNVGDNSGETLKNLAEDKLGSLGAYNVTFSEAQTNTPNTVVYKFSQSVSDEKLKEAANSLQSALDEAGLFNATVEVHFNQGVVGGLYLLKFAAIAIASAVAFQALYSLVRFKPGMALAALCSQIFVVGLYAALLAITRCPIGLEAIAFGIVAVVLNMICSSLFFDKVKKAYKEESKAKVSKLDLVTEGAQSTIKTNAFVCIAAVVAVVIFMIFAVVASPAWATLVPYGAAVFAIAACACAFGVFTPAVYSLFSAIDKRKKF